MRTIEEFITANGLTMDKARTGSNPHMADSKNMRHWAITINAPSGDSMDLVFSQGMGIKDDPTLADVLDCLANDASGVDNARNFEDWADEYGYDTDSRKAEATYDACCEQADKLKSLLGDAYPDLLWETERL